MGVPLCSTSLRYIVDGNTFVYKVNPHMSLSYLFETAYEQVLDSPSFFMSTIRYIEAFYLQEKKGDRFELNLYYLSILLRCSLKVDADNEKGIALASELIDLAFDNCPDADLPAFRTSSLFKFRESMLLLLCMIARDFRSPPPNYLSAYNSSTDLESVTDVIDMISGHGPIRSLRCALWVDYEPHVFWGPLGSEELERILDAFTADLKTRMRDDDATPEIEERYYLFYLFVRLRMLLREDATDHTWYYLVTEYTIVQYWSASKHIHFLRKYSVIDVLNSIIGTDTAQRIINNILRMDLTFETRPEMKYFTSSSVVRLWVCELAEWAFSRLHVKDYISRLLATILKSCNTAIEVFYNFLLQEVPTINLGPEDVVTILNSVLNPSTMRHLTYKSINLVRDALVQKWPRGKENICNIFFLFKLKFRYEPKERLVRGLTSIEFEDRYSTGEPLSKTLTKEEMDFLTTFNPFTLQGKCRSFILRNNRVMRGLNGGLALPIERVFSAHRLSLPAIEHLFPLILRDLHPYLCPC
jgi:hypothetical protein